MTTLCPNMVALATTSTNHRTERTKMDTKQTKSRGQETRVNKSPLIAWKAQQTHTLKPFKIWITFNPKWMLELLIFWKTIDSSQETTELIRSRGDIVKSGIYQMTGGKWKKNHEPKFPRSEKRVIEERLQQIINGRQQEDLRQRIGPQKSGGFQPQTGRAEQWTLILSGL